MTTDLDETILDTTIDHTEYTSAFPVDPAADAEELDRVLDLAGTIAPPEPEPPAVFNPPEWADLTQAEQAYVTDKLSDAQRTRDASVRYARENLDRVLKAADPQQVRKDKLPGFIRLVLAKRTLDTLGVEYTQTWSDELEIVLGHLTAKAAEAKLTELSKTLGRWKAEDKGVELGDHKGRKVLAVAIPSARWPIVVKYTTPTSKKYACKIVKDVRHYVACTATGTD